MRAKVKTEANVAAGWVTLHWLGETDPATRQTPSEEAIEEGRRRRRIEDIREASRLEREWQEVWER